MAWESSKVDPDMLKLYRDIEAILSNLHDAEQRASGLGLDGISYEIFGAAIDVESALDHMDLHLSESQGAQADA